MSDTQQTAELSRQIQACLHAGRLRESRELLIRYCRLNSTDAAAWAVLGQLHERDAELDQAVSCLERAAKLDQGNAEIHMRLAACHRRLGKLQDAAQHSRAALDINPLPVEWWWELGDLSAQLEDFSMVEQCCRAVLERNPFIGGARLYLGIALQRQGRLHEAEEALRAAVAANTGSADACFNLGLVLQALDQPVEALQCFREAHDAGMESGALKYNMALLQLRQGQLTEALDHGFQALQSEPGKLKYRQLFVRALRAALPREVSADVMAEILRCFNCTGIDSMYLMKPGMTLLFQDAQMQRLLEHAGHDGYDRLSAGMAAGEYDLLFENPLLRSLLLYTRIASPEFECVLLILRRMALLHVLRLDDSAGAALFRADAAFAIALACQFFNTEYAAMVEPHEAEQLAVLAETLLSGGHSSPSAEAGLLLHRVIVLCMYQPLYAQPELWLPIEDPLLKHGGIFRHLHRIQWQDHLTEQACRQQLVCLTPVTDVTSQAVMEQYEQSPYPRWDTVTLYEPLDSRTLFAELRPGCTPPEISDSGLRVLIAGCGTGRHAIMSASLYGDAEVLAVDLSASSLAFATRKARELDVKSLHFAQADLLELGAIGGTFQIIESVGVLHHLKNPEAGLRVLAGLMPVNGLISLGLYSRAGRRDVTAARGMIAAAGIKATAEGIRIARMEIMALPAERLESQVTRFRDFYSMSGCRDLLFHVQEWCFDLAEIAELLERAGLRFAGFELGDSSVRDAYLERYPDDPDMLELDNWHVFESEFPDTFSEMYQFWCQKI